MFRVLKEKNPHLSFHLIDSEAFSPYGNVLHGNDFAALHEYLANHTKVPETGNVYVAHDQNLALQIDYDTIEKNLFGAMKIQVGYVNGNNSSMNALEYHKSSEVNVAVTPLVLLLGKIQDIDNNTYDSQKLLAFYIPEGTVFEVYATTLHFSPCKVTDAGFKCAVLLPFGTNMEAVDHIKLANPSDRLLFKTNKWLLTHPDHEPLVKAGAHIGIVGPNHSIDY